MILYLDTSSLVKLYVTETHSEEVHRWVRGTPVAATSRVAYPETLAALARRRREDDLDAKSYQAAKSSFLAQWRDFAIIDLNEEMAGDLAIGHALRGLDAIHLAAALELRQDMEGTAVAFTAFDARLVRAAEAEGFLVLHG